LPIKRKICKIGTGLAVFLPKSWVELLRERYGDVEAVAIEVDEILKIAPIVKREKEALHERN
jgi:antitoxin component of MazEF toxin-antitoxin module